MEKLAKIMMQFSSARNPVEPPIFTGKGQLDVSTWLRKFTRAAIINHWDEEEQLHRIPLYLDEGALIWWEELR